MSHQNPTPEEVQKKLSEFMKQQFGDKVILSGMPSKADPGKEGEDETDGKHEIPPVLDFHFKPRDIKAHLDRFVIRQDEAKKVLSIAVCDHYNHVREWEQEMASQEKNHKVSSPPHDYTKQNVILLGPTGVGKTYLIRTIAELIGVPFIKADATKFSETGYVGGDVDDMIRELVQKADGNVRLAQYGIVYIDEIDKIATPSQLMGRDVSGRGVQTNLLKLMEETEVSLRTPHDMVSQIQAAMEYQRKGKVQRDTINTRHILFIVSGAFDRLEEIILRRLKQSQVGFHVQDLAREIPREKIHREVATKDFVQFGFEPEFIGRLPVRVVCDPLEESDLFHILKNSEGSILRQYERSFRSFGIEVRFQEDALQAISRLAKEEQTGARGLMTVCERIFRDFKFQLPSTGIHRLEVDAALVENPQAALEKVLAEDKGEEYSVLLGVVKEYCRHFVLRHGLSLKLEPATMDELVQRALRDKCNVRDVCVKVFKDFEFGLKLVKKNTGQTEFSVPPEALVDPDRYLSNLVVRSYRKDGDQTKKE